MSDIVFVISGGEIADRAWLKAEIAACRPSRIICADKGACHLHPLGVVPDAIIGDMDSLSPELLEHFRRSGVQLLTHPARKDETDTQLAVAHALAAHPDEVWIFGALGGRIDHTLANISLLALGLAAGVRIRLRDEWSEVFLVAGEYDLDGEPGQTVSVFPFGGAAAGITLTGFEYPLAGARMEPGNPYGISNVIAARQGRIAVGTGCLLVIRYFRPDTFPGEEPPAA